MKKLAILSFFTLISMVSFSQDIDKSDFQAVAKFYSENFYTGNYQEAMKLLVQDGRANGIEIRCVEQGECEIRDSFDYKLYGEKRSKVEGEKRLLIYWTDSSYIEITLEKQADDTWLVVGSPSSPSEDAVEIKG